MKIAIVLRKPPYGDINAAEAVRHAMGAVSDEHSVSLLMVDGGVLLAKKGQAEGDTGYTNLGEVLRDCIEMGVEVCAEKASLTYEHLDGADVVEGVKPLKGYEIAQVVKDADKVMIF
jgi:predicted peroxiredoxin